MADIRISTQVEGLQQALSDIQTLRSQLEALGGISMQGNVGGQGGAGGGMTGAGGGGGGGGGAASGSVPIPAPVPGQNNAGNGTTTTTSTTVPVVGTPPAMNTQQQQAQQLAAQADAFQHQASSYARQGLGMFASGEASAAGLGQAAGFGQMGFQIFQEIRQSNLHLGEMRQHLAATKQESSNLLQQLKSTPFGSAEREQAYDALEQNMASAAMQKSKIIGTQRAMSLGMLGAGAMAVTGVSAFTGQMQSIQDTQAIILEDPMLRYMSSVGYRAQMGFGIDPVERMAALSELGYGQQIADIEAAQQGMAYRAGDFFLGGALSSGDRRTIVDINAEADRRRQFISNVEAPGEAVQRAVGGGQLYQQMMLGQRLQQNADQTDNLKSLEGDMRRGGLLKNIGTGIMGVGGSILGLGAAASATGIGGVVGAPAILLGGLLMAGGMATGAAGKSLMEDAEKKTNEVTSAAQIAQGRLARDGAQIASDTELLSGLAQASGELGYGTSMPLSQMRGSMLYQSVDLDPKMRTQAIAELAYDTFTNRGLTGTTGQNAATLAKTAIAQGDYARAFRMGQMAIAAAGGENTAAGRALRQQLEQDTNERAQADYESNMGMISRQGTASEIELIRAGGMGVGAPTDAMIFQRLGQQAATYDPQIALLEKQIALAKDNPLEQRQLIAQLNSAKASQLGARDRQFEYQDTVLRQYEGMTSAFIQKDLTESMYFGSMTDRGAAIRATVEPHRMAVSRIEGQISRMMSGQESYSEEKMRAAMTNLAVEQEKLTKSTMEAERAVFGLAYSFQNAEKNIAGTQAQTQIVRGYGGVGASEDFMSMQRSNLATVSTAEQEIQKLRGMGVAEDSEIMMTAKQRLAGARLAVEQLPQQVLRSPFTAAASEQVAEGRFALQAVSSLPGGFGIRRELMAGQMAGLGRERQELDAMLETARAASPGGVLSPGTMAAYNQRRRELAGEQIGLLSEMSYGWQNRLMSTISGAPDMSAITPMLANRAAIGAGIRMPFFGANRTDLEESIESSLLLGSIAGAQTPAGLAAGAFTRMGPNTVPMRGNPLQNPFEGAKLEVTINGLPGTGVIRPNTGGSAMMTNVALYNRLQPGSTD